MHGMTSPMGGPSEVLWAPASEGSGMEMARFKCTTGAGLRTMALGEDSNSPKACTAPCPARGSWAPAGGCIGCKGKANGCGSTVALGIGGWLMVRAGTGR